MAFSVNYEIVAISTDKTTIFNDLEYKANIGQHFHKSETPPSQNNQNES